MCVRPAFLGGALIWHLLRFESGSSAEGQPGDARREQVAGIALLAQAWRSTQLLQDVVAQLWVGVSSGHSLDSWTAQRKLPRMAAAFHR